MVEIEQAKCRGARRHEAHAPPVPALLAMGVAPCGE
jgi:hypothetical protein